MTTTVLQQVGPDDLQNRGAKRRRMKELDQKWLDRIRQHNENAKQHHRHFLALSGRNEFLSCRLCANSAKYGNTASIFTDTCKRTKNGDFEMDFEASRTPKRLRITSKRHIAARGHRSEAPPSSRTRNNQSQAEKEFIDTCCLANTSWIILLKHEFAGNQHNIEARTRTAHVLPGEPWLLSKEKGRQQCNLKCSARGSLCHRAGNASHEATWQEASAQDKDIVKQIRGVEHQKRKSTHTLTSHQWQGRADRDSRRRKHNETAVAKKKHVVPSNG